MKVSSKQKKGKGWYLKTLDLQEFHGFDLLKFHELEIKKYPYLLESSAKGNKFARFSIIFYKPKIVLIKEKLHSKIKFLQELDVIWKENRLEQDYFSANSEIPEMPFTGGWFVYLGYELVNEIEPKINIPESPYKEIPTAFAARVNSSIIYDKLEKKIHFISDKSKDHIDEMLSDFNRVKKIKTDIKTTNGLGDENLIKLINKGTNAQHQKDVRKCIRHIYSGEIFQANLSRLWEFNVNEKIENFNLYKKLRECNPSPFGGIVTFENSSIISSSPERLVSVSNGLLQTRPIAGTRPRGVSGITDIELSKELVGSSKERAEHLMLVDLERNDISRVCEFGSVEVDEMMVVESYSHVHHIVSNIKGKLKNKVSPGEIIAAVFPGGTITGCPKVRCMEILAELEKVGRGPYTGSFGYINHSGNLDFNILIRTMIREHDKISIRAGGGIVADSIPERETFETEAKANALLKALNEFRFQ